MINERYDAAERLAGLPAGTEFSQAVAEQADALTLTILLSIVGGGQTACHHP